MKQSRSCCVIYLISRWFIFPSITFFIMIIFVSHFSQTMIVLHHFPISGFLFIVRAWVTCFIELVSFKTQTQGVLVRCDHRSMRELLVDYSSIIIHSWTRNGPKTRLFFYFLCFFLLFYAYPFSNHVNLKQVATVKETTEPLSLSLVSLSVCLPPSLPLSLPLSLSLSPPPLSLPPITSGKLVELLWGKIVYEAWAIMQFRHFKFYSCVYYFDILVCVF